MNVLARNLAIAGSGIALCAAGGLAGYEQGKHTPCESAAYLSQVTVESCLEREKALEHMAVRESITHGMNGGKDIWLFGLATILAYKRRLANTGHRTGE